MLRKAWAKVRMAAGGRLGIIAHLLSSRNHWLIT